jgi:predicted TIM-barrel fold metal-dependent hydrolase
MPSRNLGFPVFDADNHLYEPPDALTKFLPKHRKGAIDYVDLHGRTKILVRGQVSEMIPNPTFEVVARPGAQEEYFRRGNPEGKPIREVMGESMRSIPAFHEPAPRLELMDELGLDYTLMFPTLASLIEERMKDDPDLVHDVIHALNEWLFETWSYDYAGRIFTVPIITLPNVDRALEELEWVLERGARTVLVRPAPVPDYRGGSRSFGLPEFDPFWQACVKAGISVTMHASDSGYSRYLNDWEPAGATGEFTPFRFTAFRYAAMGKRPIEDSMLALVCHGALNRNPDLRVLSIENGADWLHNVMHRLEYVYAKIPNEFHGDPIADFKRGIYISPFWEEDFVELAREVGADRVIFGSDYPHPEGMADPITYVDDLAALSQEEIELIMGGNMMKLMKVDAPAKG